MTSSVRLRPVPDDVLRIAVAAHLTRYRGQSRIHTESDLHLFLRWCAERQLDPLAARRVDVELLSGCRRSAGSDRRPGRGGCR